MKPILFFALVCGLTPSLSSQDLAPVYKRSRENGIDGKYIVFLKDGAASAFSRNDADLTRHATEDAMSRARKNGARIENVFYFAGGYSARLTDDQVEALRQDPAVLSIHQDRNIDMKLGVPESTQRDTQPSPTWALDRIDQRDLPLDQSFTYTFSGKGVNAYVVDTGLRATHNEFKGRVQSGYKPSGIGWQEGDDNPQGHGTHVASLLGGSTYGVAKNVTITPLKIFRLYKPTTSQEVIVGAFDWLLANAKTPGVINLSWGEKLSEENKADYNAIEEMIRKLINKGLIVVTAAGNDGQDGSQFVPASFKDMINVGMTSKDDALVTSSNWGSAIQILAPGKDLLGANNGSDTATKSLSGTSMAAPIVSGAVALYLEANPNATQLDVLKHLKESATPGKISALKEGTPNSLLYVGSGGTVPPEPPTPTVKVEIQPQSVSLETGASYTFKASVTGSTNTAVKWTATGGSIGADGRYTAPQSAGSYTVRATSQADASKYAEAKVTVKAAASTESDLIQNGGFESGRAPWTGSASFVGSFAEQSAFAGKRCLWMGGNGSPVTEDLSQQIQIPGSLQKAELSLQLHIDTAEEGNTAYDTFQIQLLNAQGTVLKTLGNFSNLDAAGGFQKRTYDLSAYKGQTVKLQFKSVEDVSLQTSFVIDEVKCLAK